MYALLPARWQSSRATSGVSFVPAGTGHQFQGRRNLVLREHIQERRLVESHAERLLERVVEHRIARFVAEIGENDGVFLG